MVRDSCAGLSDDTLSENCQGEKKQQARRIAHAEEHCFTKRFHNCSRQEREGKYSVGVSKRPFQAQDQNGQERQRPQKPDFCEICEQSIVRATDPDSRFDQRRMVTWANAEQEIGKPEFADDEGPSSVSERTGLHGAVALVEHIHVREAADEFATNPGCQARRHNHCGHGNPGYGSPRIPHVDAKPCGTSSNERGHGGAGFGGEA
jgi:hypothetical protein